MEGKASASRNSMPGGGGSYNFLGLQGSMQLNQHQNPHSFQSFMALRKQNQDVFPFRVRKIQESDQPVSFLNHDKKVEKEKNLASDDDGSNVVEEGIDGKKEFAWQRVKWTDKMVRLLITAVSYIGEEATFDCNSGGRTSRSALLPKKGKWKSISQVMDERGYHVSPQQCEDKFNDLNKRYKRLNDILGKGTSCKVVENPTLLDLMDLSEKAKDDVRKILSSKQLFYEELCSYHNGNRLYLPHDRPLQQSLQLALKSKDNFEPHELTLHKPDDLDEEDQDAASDDRNGETEEGHTMHNSNEGAFVFPGVSAKRKKREEEHEVVGFGNALSLLRSDSHPLTNCMNVNRVLTEGGEAERFQNQWMMSRSLQLEEQKLKIQAQMLELEKQRFKWLRINEQEDMELDKMRLENEFMKLKNERLALELKRREMGADYN